MRFRVGRMTRIDPDREPLFLCPCGTVTAGKWGKRDHLEHCPVLGPGSSGDPSGETPAAFWDDNTAEPEAEEAG